MSSHISELLLERLEPSRSDLTIYRWDIIESRIRGNIKENSGMEQWERDKLIWKKYDRTTNIRCFRFANHRIEKGSHSTGDNILYKKGFALG